MIHQLTVRDFIPKNICNGILYWYSSDMYKPEELPFPEEKNNMTNTVYKSNRSKGLQYNFVENPITRLDINAIKKHLKNLVNVDFNGDINNHCLPVFRYTDGGVIKAHRDIDKTSEEVKYQDLVAVIMLTQRNEDFDHGRFYINAKAKCSVDGKTVTGDRKEDRFYPMLNKGDLFIFDNKKFIHGVEATETSGDQTGRFTCSFRTK